jgi:hypothetical protein
MIRDIDVLRMLMLLRIVDETDSRLIVGVE